MIEVHVFWWSLNFEDMYFSWAWHCGHLHFAKHYAFWTSLFDNTQLAKSKPKFFCIFSFPQANGHTFVNFGCTHPIDELFWNVPIYLLGFFSKYEHWVIDLIVPLYHFIFLGCHLPFCIMRFHITMKCEKKFICLIF